MTPCSEIKVVVTEIYSLDTVNICIYLKRNCSPENQGRSLSVEMKLFNGGLSHCKDGLFDIKTQIGPRKELHHGVNSLIQWLGPLVQQRAGKIVLGTVRDRFLSINKKNSPLKIR